MPCSDSTVVGDRFVESLDSRMRWGGTGRRRLPAGLRGAHGPCDHGHMTMKTKTRSIPAGRFKACCLALLDEVAATGETLVVTKRGRPVAQVIPIAPPRGLVGSIRRERDLVSPIGDRWHAER